MRVVKAFRSFKELLTTFMHDHNNIIEFDLPKVFFHRIKINLWYYQSFEYLQDNVQPCLFAKSVKCILWKDFDAMNTLWIHFVSHVKVRWVYEFNAFCGVPHALVSEIVIFTTLDSYLWNLLWKVLKPYYCHHEAKAVIEDMEIPQASSESISDLKR